MRVYVSWGTRGRRDQTLPQVGHDVLGLQVRQAQILRVLRLVQHDQHPPADPVVPAYSMRWM